MKNIEQDIKKVEEEVTEVVEEVEQVIGKFAKRYGWKKDITRIGDLFHNFFIHPHQHIIQKVDLRPGFASIPVYNQGELGSCTANSLAGAFEYDLVKQNLTNFMPSRLFIYYNERVIENDVDQDAGGQLRDGVATLGTLGVCNEDAWPYDIAKFADKPTDQCFTDALQNKAVQYKRVEQTLPQMKQCLLNNLPFVFGFTVYQSFESEEVAKTGYMTMPTLFDKPVGGHAVLCVGFDDEKKVFIVRNSWGEDWGDKGYFYMPYAYLTSSVLASDLWTVENVN